MEQAVPPIRLSVLIALALASACDRNSGGSSQPAESASAEAQAAPTSGVIDRSHKGAPLPSFTFADPSGKQLSVPGLKGRPVLINLWATWCGPCAAEMPALDKLATDNARYLKVVTISQDGGPEPVVQFFAAHRFRHLEPWLDPEGRIDYHYATGHFPTTVYYDADGREVWRYVGARDWSDADTTAMLIEGTV
jgi:thiol-disulfide isomerase/thioredoxin